jgi:hypothetical protein
MCSRRGQAALAESGAQHIGELDELEWLNLGEPDPSEPYQSATKILLQILAQGIQLDRQFGHE